MARDKDNRVETSVENVGPTDVSPKQVVSVASACIPFENDTLTMPMGANMQRQAVPLLNRSAGSTGIDYKAAHDSGVAMIAKKAGPWNTLTLVRFEFAKMTAMIHTS
ncbi:MAG: hypothetical protein ACLSH6_06170 [Limosilactobacillus pontis]